VGGEVKILLYHNLFHFTIPIIEKSGKLGYKPFLEFLKKNTIQQDCRFIENLYGKNDIISDE